MIAKYVKKTNIYIGVFLIGTFTTIFLGAALGLDEGLITILSLIFGVLFFIGLYYYALAKGYSGWFVLLGFLNLIGLIIMVLLPDKMKKG